MKEKTVKYIINATLAVTVSFSATSCDFLQVEKIGKSDIESFYADVYSAEAAVNGLYNLTYKYFDRYAILYPEVTGDLIQFGSTTTSWQEQYNFISSETEETSPVGYIWRYGYEIILNANEIIYYAPRLKDEYPAMAARIDNAVAQAYFIRALATLEVALAYSQHYTYTSDASHLGIAVMTRVPGATELISRTSCRNTYAQIISDLNTAYEMFDGRQVDIHFASRAACKALLARVYLYMGNYAEAASNARAVIDDYNFSLTPHDDYAAMFCSVETDGPEAILRLDGDQLSTNLNQVFNYLTPAMYPSEKLLGIFRDNTSDNYTDIRASLLTYTEDNADGTEITYDRTCMKYTITDKDVSEDDRHYDPFIFRLSEMYLIRAEANCAMGNLSDAADDIAALQARAYGVDKSTVSVRYSDAADLDAIIQIERIKELYMEGHRLYDITRRKENLERDPSSNSTVKTITYPDDRFILPIPLVELDANDAMQPNPINATQR